MLAAAVTLGEVAQATASASRELSAQIEQASQGARAQSDRAGEAGRGFAVVADEVRKLAEKTMTATKEVGAAVGGIQTGAATNVANVKRTVEVIEQATSRAAQSGEALGEIVSLADAVASQIHSIATASEQQSATSEEINRSIEDINRISLEASDGMRQSAQAVGELASQSGVLTGLIDEMRSGSGGAGRRRALSS